MESSGHGAPPERRPLRDLLRAAQKPVIRARAPGRGPSPPTAATQLLPALSEAATAVGPLAVANAGAFQDRSTAVPAPAAATASAPIRARPPGLAGANTPQPERPICCTGANEIFAAATTFPSALAPESAILDGPCNGAVGRSGGDDTGGQTGPAVHAGDIGAPAGVSAMEDGPGGTVDGRSGAGAGVAVPASAQVPGDDAAGVAASSAQTTAVDKLDPSVESPARQPAAGGRLLPSITFAADAATGPGPADVASTQVSALGGSGPAVTASLGFARQPTDPAALTPQLQPQTAGCSTGSGESLRSGAAAPAVARPPGGYGAGDKRQGSPNPRSFMFKRTVSALMLKGSKFFIPMELIRKTGLRSLEDLGSISMGRQRVPLSLLWGGQTFTFVIQIKWQRPPKQAEKEREGQLGRQQQQQQQQPDLRPHEREGQPGQPQGGQTGATSAVAGEQLAQERGGDDGEARAAAVVTASASAAAIIPMGVFIEVEGVLFEDENVQVGDLIRFERLADASYRLSFTAPDGSIRTPRRAGTAAEAAPTSMGDTQKDCATAAATGIGSGTAAGGRNAAAAAVDPGAAGTDAAAVASTVLVSSSNGVTAPDGSIGRGEVAPSDRVSNETAGDMSTTSGGARRRPGKGPAAAYGEVEYCPEDCGYGVEGEAECARRTPAPYGATAACRAAVAPGTTAGEVPLPLETRGSVPALRGAAAGTGPVLAEAAAVPQTELVAINMGGALTAAAAGTTGPEAALPPAKGKKYSAKASSGGSGGRAVAAKQAPDTAAALQAAAMAPERVAEPGTDAGAAGPDESRGAAKAARRALRLKHSDSLHCKVLTACSWQRRLALNKALTQSGGVFEGLPVGLVLMQEAGGTTSWTVRYCEVSGSSRRVMTGIRSMLKGLGLSKDDCASESVQLRFERIDTAGAGGAGSSGGVSSAAAGSQGEPLVAAFTVQVYRLAGGPMPTTGAGAGKAAAAQQQQQQQLPGKKQRRKPRTAALPPALAGPAGSAVGAAAGFAEAAVGKRQSDGPAHGSGPDGPAVERGQEQGLACPPSKSYRAAASTLTMAHLRSHIHPRPASGPAATSAAGLGLAGGGGSGAGSGQSRPLRRTATAELNLFGVVFPAGPVAARARAAAASWLARKFKVTMSDCGGGGGYSPAGDWEVPGLDAQGRTEPGWPPKAWHTLFGPNSVSGPGLATMPGPGVGSPSAPLSVPFLLEGLQGLLEQRLKRGGRDGEAARGLGSGAGASASAEDLSPMGPFHLGCLRPCLDEERGGLGVCTEAPVAKGAPLGVLAGHVLEGRRAGPWDAGANGGGNGGGRGGGDELTADAAVYARDGFQWIQDEELVCELRRRCEREPENVWQFLALSYQFPYPDELSDAATLWSGDAAGIGSRWPEGGQSQPQQAQPAKAHVLCMLGHGNVLSLLNDARPMTLELALGNQPAAGGLDARSIHPNCGVVPVAYRGVVLPVVVALRPLQPGEQLLADYGDGWWRELAVGWELVPEINPRDLLHDPNVLKALQLQLPPQPRDEHQQQPPASTEPSPTSVGGVNGAGGLRNAGEAKASAHAEEPQQQQGLQGEKQQRPEVRPEGHACDGYRRERQGRGDQGQEGPDRKRRRSRSPERPRVDRGMVREGEQDRRRGRDGDGDGKRGRSRSQGPRDRGRDRERNWGRNLERNGERDGEWDRGWGRERDRERNHPRGPWYRSASRDRDRGGRDRDRDRDRVRDKDRDRDRDRDRGRDGRPRDHRDRDPRDGRDARDRAREPARDRDADKGRPDPERGRDRDRIREQERPRDRDRDRQGDRARDRDREQERRKVFETRGPSAERPLPAEAAAMRPPDRAPPADSPSGAAPAAAGGADGEGRAAAATAGAVIPAAGGESPAKGLPAEGEDRAPAGAPMSGAALAAASAGAGRAAVMGSADSREPAATGVAVLSGRGASQQGSQQPVQQPQPQQPAQPQGARSLWPGPSQAPVARESDPGWSPIRTPPSGAASGAVGSPFASLQPAPADAAAAAEVPGKASPQPPPGVGLASWQQLPYNSVTSHAAVATGMLPAPPLLPGLPPPLPVLPAAAAAGPPRRDRKRPSSRERATPAAVMADLQSTGPSPSSPHDASASEQSGKECPPAFATARGLAPGQGQGQRPDTGRDGRFRQAGAPGEGGRPQPLRRWPSGQQPPSQQALAENPVGGGAKATLAPGSLGFGAEPYGMEGDVDSSAGDGAADRPSHSGGGARMEGRTTRGKKRYAPYSCLYRSKRDETLTPPPAMPDLGWEAALLQRMEAVSRRPDPLVPAAFEADPGEGIPDTEDDSSRTLDVWWRKVRCQRLRRQAARAAAAAAAGQPTPRVSARPLPDFAPRYL